MTRIALVADTDSRWKWGMATVAALGQALPAACFLVPSLGPPSGRQLREAGVDPSRIEPIDLPKLTQRLTGGGFDAAVLALPGSSVQLVLQAVASWQAARPGLAAARPALVTGYVGVILHRPVEGLALRAGSDIVLANSPHDAVRFRSALTAMGADPAAVVETRLPFLVGPPARHEPSRYTVTFAAQPGIPAVRTDRAYIASRLVSYARRHPEHDVIFKLRGLPGERLTHPEPYPYGPLLRRAAGGASGASRGSTGAAGGASGMYRGSTGMTRGPKEVSGWPVNLSLQAGPMRQVLARTDLLLTVSSTAAAEAIHAGIATGVLTDFGLGEDYGVPFYLGSGCLVSFGQVDAGAAPLADPVWAAAHGLDPAVPPAGPSPAERLAFLLESGLAPLAPVYTESSAPVYLASLAQRTPAQRIAAGPVQRAARAAYRTGISVIAPALRRLGA
ncbi:MAG: hypothetical protein LBJ62_03935 [Bifidobacteriaceae bacterium]|nr:hypothetical protein [Bifidobacteriaceae bacterium]